LIVEQVTSVVVEAQVPVVLNTLPTVVVVPEQVKVTQVSVVLVVTTKVDVRFRAQVAQVVQL
jgi:hypothetical protein